MDIPISQIEPEKATPSRALLKSIRDKGIIVPLVLAKSPAGYRLIDGRRRLAAAIELGLPSVPAVVIDGGEAETILLHATRSDNPVAELRAVQALVRAGMSEREIARAGYASPQRIARLARLNRVLPELLERAAEGEIAPSVLFQLSLLPPEEQRQLAGEERITAPQVHEARQAQRQPALGGLEQALAEGPADVDELFAALPAGLLTAVLEALPQEARFAPWKRRIEKILSSKQEVRNGR